MKREDKDSLTVASRTAVRRLDRRGEDKDLPTLLIFPYSTTPPPRLPWLRRLRRVWRAMSAFSPLVDPDPEAERATGRKGMVMCDRTGWRCLNETSFLPDAVCLSRMS